MKDCVLIHEDCLTALKKLEPESVDMVLADLPYGSTACKWDSLIPFNHLWPEINRVAKQEAALLFFGCEPFSSTLRMSNIKSYRYDWYWEKNRGGGFLTAKKRPLARVETISVFYRKQPNYFPIFVPYSASTQKRFAKNPRENGDKMIREGRTNALQGVKKVDHQVYLERGKYPDNICKFKVPDPQNGARFHPTQKPVDLLEYLIKTYTREGDTVLDPTMGSGSTGIAARNLRRRFIGIERDGKFMQVAEKRIFHALPLFEKEYGNACTRQDSSAK